MKYASFALAALAPLLSVAAPISSEACEAVTIYASEPTSVATSAATGSATESAIESSSASSSVSASPSASPASISNTSSSSGSGSAIGYASQNGGTTGGAGGEEVTVTSVDELVEAVKGDEARIIYVEGTLEGTATIRTGSNKSILGKDSDAHIIGAGILVKEVENVIIQNLKIGLVREEYAEDAIGIDAATNVWVDHCDLYSDLDHGKDYYDGTSMPDYGSTTAWLTNIFTRSLRHQPRCRLHYCQVRTVRH